LTLPALTVIVACYNVAPFLSECLRSILRQPQAGQLEVLVIDDGSVDDTAARARQEIAAHPQVRCRLVQQPNQGLSGARNTGLHLARGSYLTFVDGDDVWKPDYLALVLPEVLRGRADIIAFNASIVDLAGQRLDGLRFHRRISARERNVCRDLAEDAAEVGQWQAWARVYRTRLLERMTFPPGRLYEDVAVLPLLYARAGHIHTFSQELYAYRRRPGSITSTITDKHVDDLLLSVREAGARLAEAPPFWSRVRRNTLRQIACEIGTDADMGRAQHDRRLIVTGHAHRAARQVRLAGQLVEQGEIGR